MKTPDEIKKGLECCMGAADCCACPYKKEYSDVDESCVEISTKEALAYIRQLEAERDALLNETKGFCTSCAFRKECHKRENVIGDCLKLPLLHLGDCKHWQWRGVQKEVE